VYKGAFSVIIAGSHDQDEKMDKQGRCLPFIFIVVIVLSLPSRNLPLRYRVGSNGVLGFVD